LVLRVCAPARLPSRAAIDIEVEGASTAARLPLVEHVAPGELALAVPAESRSGPGTADVYLQLGDAEGATLSLAATPDGHVVADAVRPTDDGLRLAYVDDLVVYERTNALPRIRWAGSSTVEVEPLARLEMLAAGTIPDDVVLLSDEGPEGSGAEGEADVVLDAPTSIEVDVSAAGDGYLVVADAMQQGWRAQVDGRAVDLVAADHAGAAVHVPEGDHTVTLRYRPPGQRAGVALSGLTAVGLAGAWFWGERRHRRNARSRVDAASDD
jgi:hypothetical protein